MGSVAGMDLGASGVKLAVFSGHGAKAKLTAFLCYDAVAEGVLSDRELYSGISGFLRERKLTGIPLTLGIPSYDLSIKVSDYPACRSRDLCRMVALDAEQVGGLSEEAFVHDFLRLPPGLGRQNPVLLCMVHETGLRERLAGLESAGLHCANAQGAVVSLAVAAFDLIEGLESCGEPAVLLDIGQENTTLAVVAGGQILHSGSLLFGAEKFAEACGHQRAIGSTSAGRDAVLERLNEADLTLEFSRSELVQAAQALEAEIQGSLGLWRSQELESLANAPITRCYVTGGGSRLKGLVTWLEGKLECRVEAFAPRELGSLKPEMTVAYGLGLQACGKSPLQLCLLPADVRDLRQRQRRWPFLAVASALGVGSCLIGLLIGILMRSAGTAALEEERASLQEQVDQAGQLRAASEKALEAERKVRELGEAGNRGRRLLKSLRLFARGRLNTGWIIYLADGRTAYAADPFFGLPDKEEPRAARRLFAPAKPIRQERTLSVDDDIPPEQFVTAGYVPLDHGDEIQGLMRLLNGGEDLFHGVDRGNSVADSAGALIWEWRAFLNRDSRRLRKGLKLQGRTGGVFADAFELFTLKLPLEAGTEPAPKGRKRR